MTSALIRQVVASAQAAQVTHYHYGGQPVDTWPGIRPQPVPPPQSFPQYATVQPCPWSAAAALTYATHAPTYATHAPYPSAPVATVRLGFVPLSHDGRPSQITHRW
jgi:hypothetical protein